jgi:replicative DNA helicase
LKELPHDYLSEKSLLGCLILDGSSFDQISDLSLARDDFHHPHYGLIYETISEVHGRNLPLDFVTVCARLSDKGILDQIGHGDERGQSFILRLIEDQASTANIYYYAKLVKEKSLLRKIILMAQKIAEDGQRPIEDTKEFLYQVESFFYKLSNEVRVGGVKKLSNCLKENLQELADPERKPGELLGISTGFKILDEKLLGMRGGQLIIVAARPGMGKTSFGLNIASHVAKHVGLPVIIFSFEMLAHELSMRLLSHDAKIDAKKLRMKDFHEVDLKNLAVSFEKLSSLPMFIEDSGFLTIHDIQSTCRKIKAEHGLGLVVIDYVQLMKTNASISSREQQISEISRGLKHLAKELECPVMALSQLNRGVESRTEKRPMVSDLRESGSLEQDADVVCLIYRDEFYFPESKDQGIAEIIIGKNRAGETGTVKLAWKGKYTSFANLIPDGSYGG